MRGRVALYAGNRKSRVIAACHCQEMGYELENTEDDYIVAQAVGSLGSAVRFTRQSRFPMSICVSLGKNAGFRESTPRLIRTYVESAGISVTGVGWHWWLAQQCSMELTSLGLTDGCW